MISSVTGGTYMDPSQMGAMKGPMGSPFEKIDSNGDGSLNESELNTFAEKMSEMTGPSKDGAQMIAELDSDGDGLLSQKEFDAGRPEGPPPEMMAMMPGMQGGDIRSFLDMLNSDEDDESSSSGDPLDTNGDGIVDAEEAKAGINYLLEEYKNQATGMLFEGGGSGSLINSVG